MKREEEFFSCFSIQQQQLKKKKPSQFSAHLTWNFNTLLITSNTDDNSRNKVLPTSEINLNNILGADKKVAFNIKRFPPQKITKKSAVTIHLFNFHQIIWQIILLPNRI